MSIDKSTSLEEQYDKIYRYCYFKVKKQELAEDITQETFLRFYERFGHYGNGWTLQYLYRIAHNLCVDEYKKQIVDQLPEDKAEGSFENKVLNQVVMQDALSKLSVEEKELLLLRYVNEVPVSVICNLFHMSRFAVYRKIKQALKKMQLVLGEEEQG